MRISIKAKPFSGKEFVEKIDETNYTVWVKEPPEKGLANKGIERALAEYFKVPRLQVRIVKGFTSRNKIVEVI